MSKPKKSERAHGVTVPTSGGSGVLLAQVMSPSARRVNALPLPGDMETQRQALADLAGEARKYKPGQL